jgi:hypothetical protein
VLIVGGEPMGIRVSVWLSQLGAVLLLVRAVAWGAEQGGHYAVPVLIGLLTAVAFSACGLSLPLRSRQGYMLLFVLGCAPFLHGLIAGALIPLRCHLAGQPFLLHVSRGYYAVVLATMLGLGCLYWSLLRGETRSYVWRREEMGE